MTPEPATSAPAAQAAAASPVASEPGLVGWLLTRDHKRIGILILATGFVIFLFDGVLGLTMRAQLACPVSTSSALSSTTKSSPCTAPA